MGGSRVGSLKTRVGRECCVGKGGARWTRLNSRDIQGGEVRRGRQDAGPPEQAGAQQDRQPQE